MGTYSFYLTSRNKAKDCIVNWNAMDKNRIFKSYVLQNCYQNARTLEDVAIKFDESKFFGYMIPEFIEALIEFNKHLVPYGCHPKIYYDFEGEDAVKGLEFIPGTDNVYLLSLPYNDIYNFPTTEVLKTSPELDGWLRKRLT